MTRPARILLTLHDGATRVGYLGGVAALALVTASYVFEVAARYFFNAPTTWASDLVGYSLCAGVFLMLPYVTATRGHVAVTLVIDAVPSRFAALLHAVINILGFAFCLFAAWISYSENVRQITRGVLTLGNDPIPKWWVSIFITFGLLAAAFHFLRHLLVREERPVQ